MKRSALTLRGLVHEPSGSILAAATTSLPGGHRRRPQLGLPLLLAARRRADRVGAGLAGFAAARRRPTSTGCTGCSRRCPAPSGCTRCTRSTAAALPPEAVIDRCPATPGRGRCASATRRTRRCSSTCSARSSSSSRDLAHARERRASPSRRDPARPRLGTGVCDGAGGQRRWHEPDHGIWEIRDNPRHHVYSKVMGWLTVDRALDARGRSSAVTAAAGVGGCCGRRSPTRC